MSDRTGSTVVGSTSRGFHCIVWIFSCSSLYCFVRMWQRFAPQALMLAMQGQPLNTACEAGVLRTDESSMFATVEDLAKEEVLKYFSVF